MTREERGFTLVEFLVSLAILALVLASLATLLIQNARINRSQQLTLAAQASARGSLAMIVPVLRSAGWDPRNVGFTPLVFDPSGDGNFLEVFADLNEDGDTADPGEDVTIRFASGRIEWKTQSSATVYQTMAEEITNDADGNGVAEPMFVPDSTTATSRVTVRVTARSPIKDPSSGRYIRATATTDVFLRSSP